MEGELLKAVDRSGKPFVFSPTHEEAVTALVAGVQPISHRYHLPQSDTKYIVYLSDPVVVCLFVCIHL